MDSSNLRRAVGRAVIGFGLAGLVASCGGMPSGPAPVYIEGEGQAGWAGAPPQIAPGPLAPSMPAELPPPAAPMSGRRVLVRRGQSLSGIAYRYHVPQRAIIAANHLRPPYQIDIGSYLLIPGIAGGPIREAEIAPPPRPLPPPAAEAPLAEERQPPPPASTPLAEGMPPAASAVTPLASAAPPAPQPQEIPLDGPARSAAPPPAAAPPGEPSVAEEAREDAAASPPAAAPAMRQGRFPWPVQGRVLAGFGTSGNGAHNDGINIAAPRGTPVRVIAGGEVAYAGNQVPGYGNLILVKHPGGWISAYAHLQNLAVRRGESVHTGEIIARVGTTGGVSQPQLHFELRRGEHPVDPRDFLAPLPSADNGAGNKAG